MNDARNDPGSEPVPERDEQPLRDQPPIERTNSGRWRVTIVGAIVLLIVVVLAVLFAWRKRNASYSTVPPSGMTMPAATGDMAGMQGMAMPPQGQVQLTAEEIRQFGVTFDSAEERPLATDVRAEGSVTVDEGKLADVVPKFGGFVDRLHVDETGQPVRRGQPLMDVYSPELVAAEQELLVAGTLERSIGQSAVPGVPASSPHLLEAAKRRLALWDISDAQIEEILHSGHVRRTLTLYAPTSGIVLEKHIVQGQAFEPGQMLYRIAKLDTVWLNAEVREVDAGVVREGSRATAELAAYPGRSFTGRVAYVYPTLDSAARSLGVRIEMPNPHGLLKLGMYATVHITTPVRTALTIRTSAVLRTGTRALVFVDMGNGRLMPRDIVLGTVAGDYVEVRSGLEPGQRVVTSAQFLLDSESNLAEVMKSMIGEMNMPTGGHTAPRSDMQDMRDTPGMQMPSDSSTR